MASKRPRRGRGEGAVYRRQSDGLYCATVTVGYNENGKRKRRTVSSKTKSGVLEKLTQLQMDFRSGTLVDPNRLTVASFLREWLEDEVRANLAKATYVSYEKQVRLYLIPALGGVPLAQLTELHVKRMLAEMRRDGASDRTCELTYTVLRSSMNCARGLRLVRFNPCDGVKKPTAKRKPMKVLDLADVRKFLTCAQDDRLHALYVLAIDTGMRQGEILGLHWEHVDLRAGRLSVVQALHEDDGILELGPLKNEQSRRQLPLSPSTISALKAHRKAMLVEGHPGPMVFCAPEGGYLRKSNLVQRSFQPILNRAKLQRVRFHDLRHTAATLLLRAHVPIKVVQERLGHASIKVTLDYYAHVLPSMQEEATARMEEVLSNTRLKQA